MRKFAEQRQNFLKREDGPTAVEYAVMLALIIVVCITAITALGTNANKTFTTSATLGTAPAKLAQAEFGSASRGVHDQGLRGSPLCASDLGRRSSFLADEQC